MKSIVGERLLEELLETPEKFNKNKYKGYELLNEYLRGFDVKTLIIALESDNELIYRIAISICSELSKSSCSVLLPSLLSLLEIEKDSLYIHYLLSAIFKATYESNYKDFSSIVYQLTLEEYKIRASAMNLMVIANENQLKESFLFFNKIPKNKILADGLFFLINIQNLNDESIIDIIKNDIDVIQLFGGILAAKLYNEYPEFIRLSAASSNLHLKEFSIEVLELKEGSSMDL